MSRNKDDDKVWDRVAQGVTPLKSRNRAVASITNAEILNTRKKPEKKAPIPAPLQTLRATTSVAPAIRPDSVQIEVGASAGVDKRTADRLRRGKMTVDGTLDLHGMTQARAHSALTLFLDTAHLADKRCLLVITGKGQGILKRAVPFWLSDPFLRPKILSVMTARQEHGGEGALYVLLRRRRPASM